jgi:hypothetical protein
MKLTQAQIEELRSLLARCSDAPMTRQEAERLNELLASDAQAQQMFVDYAMLDACLEMVWAGGEERENGDLAIFAPVPAEQSIPVIIQASPILSTPLSAFHTSVGGLLFSYGVAAFVVAVGLMIGWACQVSYPQADLQQIVDKTPHLDPAPITPESETAFVGRITGMVDCRWVDPRQAPIGFDRIVLGRKYALASGLMEISYDSGAKVILQGPCTYQVESKIGGFLSFGRVTAKVGTHGENKIAQGKSQGRGRAEGFFVRTPSATVTDLGTEFGVEVDTFGASKAHVFQGKVELRANDGSVSQAEAVPLGENESARVDVGKDNKRVVTVSRRTSEADKFVRRFPKRVRIKLFNTGINLKLNQDDPHWQVIARSDEPNFKPRPAVVSGGTNSMWLANQLDRSQWISFSGGDSSLPDRVVYTFRTTFDLTGMRPGTAILHGRFVVDNQIEAIRLNGREVRTPSHNDEDFGFFHAFSIAGGFVDGVNVLEFEVKNGARWQNVPSSPMGLLVELEGSVLSAWPEPSTIKNNANNN